MTIQNLFQEINSSFPDVSPNYFIKLFNEAQLKFTTDTGILQKGVALTDMDEGRTFTLPTDFIRLKRVDFLDTNNEIIYEPLIYYCGQGKITFDSPIESILTIPGEIANIILLYVHKPIEIVDIGTTGMAQTISIPEQFIDGVMARVRRKLHETYGTITRQGQDGSIVKQKDWTAVKYYTDFYNDEVRKAIKYINSIDSSAMTIRAIGSAGDIPQYTVNPLTPALGTSTVTIHRTWGTTAQRPTGLTTSDIGFEYYDTDIQSPVWWNGTVWDDTL